MGVSRKSDANSKEPARHAALAQPTRGQGPGTGTDRFTAVRLLGTRLLRVSRCPQPEGQLGRSGGQGRYVLVTAQPPGCGRRSRAPGVPEVGSRAFPAVCPGPGNTPPLSLC